MLARDDPRRGNIRQAEIVLRRCAAEARRRGSDLVYDSFDYDDLGGVCILAAYEYFGEGLELGLPEGDAIVGAWDAIEHGFDGIPYAEALRCSEAALPRRWYNLGRRLRRALKPRRARV